MASFQRCKENPAGPGSSMDSIEPASLLEANIRAGITNESHLQSLGFIVDNGRPRFKIDEPVRSGMGPESFRSGVSASRSNPGSIDPEDESFVVLGKDSLTSIQAASLASYAQISQKSFLTDYNSIVSSLTVEETERKLREFLQENVKLKETLKQNNLAMKQQFNTLAAWQEEIGKVHQSHKQKFSETKELIALLRKENSELKIRLSQEPIAPSDQGSKIKELEAQLQKTLQAEKAVQSAREVELEDANSRLFKELEESKTACKALMSDVHRYKTLSSRFDQQLKQAYLAIEGLKLDNERLELRLKEREQLASLADFSLLSISSKEAQECEIWKEKSSHQEKEIAHLRELVSSLEQQLNATSQRSLPSIEIQTGDNCGGSPSQDRLQFIKNVKQYNKILEKLSECYAKQGSGYVNVQQSLKEAIDVIQDLGKITSSEEPGVSQQDQLENCKTRLNDERLEMINERQELIKAQNQFQKVFSDYNSVLYELEIMYEENTKLSCVKDSQSEAEMRQKTEDAATKMSESMAKESKSLEDAKASISQVKSEVIEEKKAKEVLQSECDSLRIDLSRQKLLNEAEQRSFSVDRKRFQETIKDLQHENEKLENTVKSNSEQVDHLKAEIKSMNEDFEKVPVLQAQLDIFKADFEEERSARQRANEEKDNLFVELKKLQKLHMELIGSLKGNKASETQQYQQQQWQQSASAPPQNSAFRSRCPACGEYTNNDEWHGWGFCSTFD